MKNKQLDVLNSINIGKKPKSLNFDAPLEKGVFDKWNPDLRAKPSAKGENVIEILDVIGHDFFGDGITTQAVSRKLNELGESAPVTVVINSVGGDLFEGIGIYNLLKEHKGEITVKVIGLAASAASLVAMAGDKILIAKSGFIMIHNAWTRGIGDKNEFLAIADYLKPLDATIAEVYLERSKIESKEEIQAMMDKETWFSGTESVENGLADSLLDDESVSNGVENSHSIKEVREFETICKAAGMTRSETKEAIQRLKIGKSGAVNSGSKLGAANELNEFLEGLRSIKIEN